MFGIIAALQRATYEAPAVVMLGPLWSAIISGFAIVDVAGRVHLTPAGEDYLHDRRCAAA